MYPILIHLGWGGRYLIKGGSQIPISPPPADPDNQRPGLLGRGPVLINMGTGCSGVGGPQVAPLPQSTQPPHVEGMWPGTAQEGVRSLVPTPFLTSRAACFGYGSGMDCGGSPRQFFGVGGVSLQPIPDLRARYAPEGGTHDGFLFKIQRGVPPKDSYQMLHLELAGIQVGSPVASMTALSPSRQASSALALAMGLVGAQSRRERERD